MNRPRHIFLFCFFLCQLFFDIWLYFFDIVRFIFERDKVRERLFLRAYGNMLFMHDLDHFMPGKLM